jgi:O-antigen ligase
MNLITSKPLQFLLGPLQLLLFVFPFTSLFLAFPGLAPVQGLVNVLGFVCICTSIVYLLFSDEIRIRLTGTFPLFLFLGFIVLSTLWVLPELRANSQHVTTRTVLTVLQAFVIVNVLGREQLFRTLKQYAILVAVANLAFIFLFPSQASWYFEDSSRIQGLFSSPNNMGQFLAFAFIIINFYERERLPVAILLALDAAIVYQLLRCDSMTSLGGVVVIFISYRLRFLLRPLFYVVIGLGLLVPSLNRIMGSTDAPLGLNNRDLTFTGRTDVWAIMQSDLITHDRVATGFGSGGYWLADDEYNPFSHIYELEWSPGQGTQRVHGCTGIDRCDRTAAAAVLPGPYDREYFPARADHRAGGLLPAADRADQQHYGSQPVPGKALLLRAAPACVLVCISET